MINANHVINPLLPQKFKGLTDDVEICEVACSIPECIDDFRWRAEPSWPQEYSAFKSLSKDDRNYFLEKNEKFFRIVIVADYLDQRDAIINKNERNFKQLKEWQRLVISENARELVDKMINTYSGRM